LVSGEIMVFLVIIKRFPIVGGVQPDDRQRHAAPGAQPVAARP
jgi:hypothetical protein